MLKIIKVSGRSLEPEYKEGDYVVIITIPFFSFKMGDTIVFQHQEYGTMIKCIERVVSDKIHVLGLHINSIDSRQFGPIDRSSVIGKVIWHIRKPGKQE